MTVKIFANVHQLMFLRIENCVVGICNNGMFLEFHEFETKYLAGVYKRH